MQEIDIVFLAEISEKYENIGQFFLYVLKFFCGEIAGLLGRLPEEVFKQFPRFNLPR